VLEKKKAILIDGGRGRHPGPDAIAWSTDLLGSEASVTNYVLEKWSQHITKFIILLLCLKFTFIKMMSHHFLSVSLSRFKMPWHQNSPLAGNSRCSINIFLTNNPKSIFQTKITQLDTYILIIYLSLWRSSFFKWENEYINLLYN
jgi:hypothetical protein